MSTSSGPFAQPVSATHPGLGRLFSAMMVVFVLGLGVIGMIYLTGTPVVGTVDAGENTQHTAAVTPKTQTDSIDHSAVHPAQGKPYVAPNGVSPLPKHGEGTATPIPPDRLVSQEEYDAPPPQASTLPPPDGPVAWTEAHKYIGQTITVKGTIVDTNNIGQICFLNYDPNWQDKFYVAMFKEAFDLLPDPPEEHYLNRTLLVTGKVTLHKDRPQIEVRDVSQIEVVE